MSDTASLSATRVPATDIRIGDQIALVGLIYFTVEWRRTGPDGAVCLAGLRSTGEPHVSRLTVDAKVSRVFKLTTK